MAQQPEPLVGFRDPAVQHRFDRDGYVVLPLLEAGQAQALDEARRDLQSDLSTGFHATLFSNDLDYRAIVDDMVRRILGPPITRLLRGYDVLLGNFVVKEVDGADNSVPAHQDWTFVDEQRQRSINVWCPLTDVSPANGSLHVLSRSHQFVTNLRAPTIPSPYWALHQQIQEYSTGFSLPAGIAILYDHRLVHWSPANGSGRTRAVANVVLTPTGSQPIHLDARGPHAASRAEVFAVDRQFFLRYNIGERPTDVERLGYVGLENEALTAFELDKLCASGHSLRR